ncbi:hypothetical protein LTR36_001318 [Oleoguttula mirabilis]|uniref:Uncharacterized protein n=1 Tax=Oleoguttula mirabilis TaxID=1507867 RepID=A0AAV9JQ09_9PEZI|nr:hypothetical protein LTR36_001318 [Oleoguttula mirabilis]
MPPRRGHCGGPRGGAQAGRGRGSAAARGRSSTGAGYAGVKKSQAEKKRPIQPRVAAALASAAATATAPVEPETASAVQEDQPTEPFPQQQPEWPSPKVQRIHRPAFMCTPHSLFFIHLGQLASSADTETIALNLMDHFLQAEHFLPELWHGQLHAVCFLFASELTGMLENEIEAIAQAVEAHAAGLAEHGVQDLEVSVEGMRRGYAAVLERREQLKGLVGDYAELLGSLAGPPVADAIERVEEAVEEVEVEVLGEEEELFDFDVLEEPETQVAAQQTSSCARRPSSPRPGGGYIAAAAKLARGIEKADGGEQHWMNPRFFGTPMGSNGAEFQELPEGRTRSGQLFRGLDQICVPMTALPVTLVLQLSRAYVGDEDGSARWLHDLLSEPAIEVLMKNMGAMGTAYAEMWLARMLFLDVLEEYGGKVTSLPEPHDGRGRMNKRVVLKDIDNNGLGAGPPQRDGLSSRGKKRRGKGVKGGRSGLGVEFDPELSDIEEGG